MRSKYPDPGSGLHACLEPHSVNIAIEKRDMHVPDPPGRRLRRLTHKPMDMIGVGVHLNLSAKEFLLFTLWEQFQNVTALSGGILFFPNVSEVADLLWTASQVPV
jgi:hypothetical protein